MKPTKVFLSHSTRDNAFVRKLADDLRGEGVEVWYSEWELRVGDSLQEKIGAGIRESGWLAVILSQNSVTSSWVQRELNAGLTKELEQKQVFVLPILIEDCDIPVFLKDKLYADFRNDYSVGFGALLERILPKERQSSHSGKSAEEDVLIIRGHEIGPFVNLRGANLEGANLERANLRGAHLVRARIEDGRLKRADLFKANLVGANLRGANLAEVDLFGGRLEEADLEGADLAGALLRGANLEGANLERANLEGANLLLAKFSKACLRNTDLRGANLTRTDLRAVEELTINQLWEVKTLYQAKLDSELLVQAKAGYPRLLEHPSTMPDS